MRKLHRSRREGRLLLILRVAFRRRRGKQSAGPRGRAKIEFQIRLLLLISDHRRGRGRQRGGRRCCVLIGVGVGGCKLWEAASASSPLIRRPKGTHLSPHDGAKRAARLASFSMGPTLLLASSRGGSGSRCDHVMSRHCPCGRGVVRPRPGRPHTGSAAWSGNDDCN